MMKAYFLLAFLLALCSLRDTAAGTTTTTTTTPLQQPPPPPLPSNGSGGAAPNTPPQGAAGPGGRGPPPQNRPPATVWLQCLSQTPRSLPDLFGLWCRDYQRIIPCLTSGLSSQLAQNPLDQFLQLHFEEEKLKQKSIRLCQNFQQISNKAVCVQQNNASLEGFCNNLFIDGQLYVFNVRRQQQANNDINAFKNVACSITNDLTGCLGAAMKGCDVEVKRHLLAFYAFFTNESCVADPTVEFVLPTPPPPPPPPPPSILQRCGQRVSKIFTPVPLDRNTTPLQRLIHVQRQICRTYEARFKCYDEELSKNTTKPPPFGDLWLQFTFNSSSAIPAQRKFCQEFEGGLVNSLNDACFNRTALKLQGCEDQYRRRVGNVGYGFAQGGLDEGQVYKLACGASLRRAFCLRDAFELCGETLAEAMLQSEQATLPSICLTLLPSNDSDSTTPAEDNLTEPAAEEEPVGEPAPGAGSASDAHSVHDADSSSSASTDAPAKRTEKPVRTGAVASGERDAGGDSLASSFGCSVLLLVCTVTASVFLHA